MDSPYNVLTLIVSLEALMSNLLLDLGLRIWDGGPLGDLSPLTFRASKLCNAGMLNK